jgi:putative heme-binding domain-containing protein
LSLLQSVQDGKIARTDIPPEYWTQLRQHPNRRVAGRASRLAQESATVSADRAEVVAKMLPLAKQKGDAERGKEVYELNCSICHKFNGAGGVVGPELTGIAARDRSDILLEILDPNRSVEANYRLWNVTTKDGNTYSGRLEAETQTTVEILDVAAQKHVIQRKDIQSLSASPMSIMPVGFEALPEEDLKGLLEYLAQPHEQH